MRGKHPLDRIAGLLGKHLSKNMKVDPVEVVRSIRERRCDVSHYKGDIRKLVGIEKCPHCGGKIINGHCVRCRKGVYL